MRAGSRGMLLGMPPQEDLDEPLALLTLARAPGVGPVRSAALLQRFGDAVTTVQRGVSGAWPALPGLSAEAARRMGRLLDVPAASQERLRAQRLGANLMVFGQSPYPPRWQPHEGFPVALWWRGNWPAELNRLPPVALAVVGPRRVSALAERFAQQLAERAAEAGAVVVSGLAFGIDAAAHAGALAARRAGAPVSTVAVLASGVDQPTPTSHRPLARAILDNGGALLSAAAIGARPATGAFPVRNRFIAGLASAVAVIEAGPRSGALHTAQAALSLGLEVGTTPSRAWDEHAAGSLGLLRDGATPLLEPDDGWRLLPAGSLAPALARPAAPRAADPYAALLAAGACSIDTLVAHSGRPVGRVLGDIAQGELEGWAESLPDGRYRLRSG